MSHEVPKRADRTRRDDKVDVTDLDEILRIDVEARTCTAEPGVTFERLLRATLPLGLAPIIVPELRTITIGGAVSGCSLESMSFRHGGFHDTCLEYEVITAGGEVLRCTPDNEHALVFQMLHGSYGTLGILSELVFRLVPVKPFVRVEHKTFGSIADYRAAIARHAERDEVDFLDGFVHAPDRFVLCVGELTDYAPYASRYDGAKVYWQSTRERREDFLTLTDYYFRYDHGVTNVHPRSALGRRLFGKFFGSSELLRLAEALHWLLPDEAPPVTLDVFVPISRADAFLRWYEKAIGFFPLWCVPYKRVRDYEWIADGYFDGLDDPMFLDLAVYGMKQPRGRNAYVEIERELPKHRALKTLISYNYYDEAEFWRLYNLRNYLAVKRLTDPNNVFRDLYSKTCRAPRGLDDVPFDVSASGGDA